MTSLIPETLARTPYFESDSQSSEPADLVVRCVDRIEMINSPHAEQIAFTFTNWQISRLMRRDFHYLASSMYFANKVMANRSGIATLLQSIEYESINLTNRAKDIVFGFLSENVVPVERRLAHTVEFRIVDSNSRALFDAITRTDACISDMGSFLEPAELNSVMRDFKRSITVLSNFLLALKKE